MSERLRLRYAAAVLTAFFALLYHYTATYAYSYDGICYALDAEFGPASNLFHPNHLLYSFLAHLVYRVAVAIGHPVRVILLMQLMNAMAAGGAVGLFFIILARRFDWDRALLGAFALGVSQALWAEAVDPGCYAWATLATCGVLALLMEGESYPSFWVGVAHGFCILFHQMLILVAPAFVYRFWKRKPLAYLGGVALIVGVAYGSIGILFHGSSISQALYWALGPAGPPPNTPVLSPFWWSLDLGNDVIAFWQGLVHSLIAATAGPYRALDALWQLILILLVAFAVTASWPYFRNKRATPQSGRHSGESRNLGLDPGFRRGDVVVRALWIWILMLGLFQFFFWVGVLRYRLLILPPLIYLILELSQSITDPRPFGALGLALSLAMLVNFETVIKPQALLEHNPNLLRALWVSQTLQPQDTFLFSGGSSASIINVYVAYFAPQIRGRSLRGYFFAHPQGDLTELQELLTVSRQAHNKIYFEAALWDPDEQKILEEGGRVPVGTLGKWLSHLHRRSAYAGPGGYQIYEVD